MKANEFVTKLKKVSPLKEDLRKSGLSDEYIDGVINSYDCKMINFYSISDTKDEVLKLLKSYDCSFLEIGAIRFDRTLYQEGNFFFVGKVDTDLLVLNKANDKIQVIDYINRSTVLWECAKNSECFFDSLIKAAEFFSNRIRDNSLINNHDFTNDSIRECAELAGGKIFLKFYEFLMG